MTRRLAARLAFLWALIAPTTGCQSYGLVPQYGGVRGTIVGFNGAEVAYVEISADGAAGSHLGHFADKMDPGQVGNGGTVDTYMVSWHDFRDGRGPVLVRVVASKGGVGGTPWWPNPGQPSHHYLRAGEFVIDHVAAGQYQINVFAMVGGMPVWPAGQKDNAGGEVRTTVPVNVVPDQWTTVRIELPIPEKQTGFITPGHSRLRR